MTARDCPHFDACNAPLCPLDPGSLAGVWFADEPVCTRTEVPDWVRRQRRIGRIAGYDAGLFMLEMLNHPCRLSRGIRGIDPELSIEKIPAAVETWKKKHPAITDEERAQLRARAASARAVLLEKNGEKEGGCKGFNGVPVEPGTCTPSEAEGPERGLSGVQR